MVVEAVPDRALAPITINRVPGWRPALAPDGADTRSSRNANQNRMAVLSSGSSGEPRAHLNTQRRRMLRAAGRPIAHPRHWTTERTGVLVMTGALAATMQQDSYLAQLTIGGPTAIGPPPSTPGDLVRALAAWDNAICILNPNQCRGLLRCAGPDGLVLPRAQLLRVGGEMMSVEEKRAVLRLVTPHFCESYGSASTGTIAVAQPEDVAARPEAVGRPVPGSEVQIVDDEGHPLPANAIGRIRVRGGLVGGEFLAGSDNDPASPETYRDGWAYPGDLGALDDDGYLILKGRLGERIAQSGALVFAAEIEAALSAIDGVSEVAVVKRTAGPGPGEEAVAFVVKRADLTHEAIRAGCAERLAPGKNPPVILYIDRLPRSPGGKIDREALRRFANQPSQVNRR
jgi:acyl-coenzyme A synthetase/AMP-(fatty) acid ligase